jgi:hypothetical protein
VILQEDDRMQLDPLRSLSYRDEIDITFFNVGKKYPIFFSVYVFVPTIFANRILEQIVFNMLYDAIIVAKPRQFHERIFPSSANAQQRNVVNVIEVVSPSVYGTLKNSKLYI